MAPPDEAYRKVALLFTMLDKDAVESLLAHLERDQVVRLQHVLGELPPIGIRERRQVIQEFLQAGAGDAETPQDADGVEIDASLAARIASEEAEGPEAEPADDSPDDSPFAFLTDVSPPELAELLNNEHAQTIRIVLAYLPQSTVAEILPRLTRDKREQVLQRLEESEPIDEAVVAVVEREWERLFRRQVAAEPPAPAGTDVVRAILRGARAAGERAERNVPQTLPLAAPSEPSPEPPPEEARSAIRPAAPPPAFEFDDLNALDDASLARVFRGAEPQAALVALAAASPALVDRIRRQLPWREARDLKRQLERLGPIRLTDVESAQQQLANVAHDLVQQGAIVPPRNRRFMVAA